MMKVLRERTDLLLMEYASGALDDACSMLMASYITICPEARAYYRQCESVGGALMEECRPVAMAQGSMRMVLERIDAPATQQQKPKSEDCAFCAAESLPRPVAKTINQCSPKAKWRTGSRGMQYYNMPPTDSVYKAALIKMAPHAKAPAHRHQGRELTLVLEGGYQDEYGRYHAGDLVIIDEPVPHRPVAGPEGCLCLVATDFPVRFTGGLGSVLNFFIR